MPRFARPCSPPHWSAAGPGRDAVGATWNDRSPAQERVDDARVRVPVKSVSFVSKGAGRASLSTLSRTGTYLIRENLRPVLISRSNGRSAPRPG